MTRWIARMATWMALLIAALCLWQAAPDSSAEARNALRQACQDVVFAQARGAPMQFGTADFERRLAACRQITPAWDRPLLREAAAAGAFAVLLLVLTGRREGRH